MAPLHSRIESHELNSQLAQKRLQTARLEALRERGYNSEATRQRLREEFKSRTNGLVAFSWQIDVAEGLLLGLDTTVIAGTGAGKTLPFVMPLFIAKDKKVLIISPLNALEEDQASRFNKMGLSAVAVNGETYTKDVHKEIEEGRYNVLITSPDMCIKHDRFRSLLSNPEFASTILCIGVDEAHCISQWGDKFRPVYAELGTLRAFVAADVPFLAASATQPPLVLKQVRDTLHINPAASLHYNLGIDRHNIAWFVRRMDGGKTDLDALNFVVEPEPSSADAELNQTMVFFDDISVAMDALKHLREKMPPQLRGQIAVYHSRRSSRSKRRILREFREGKIKILLTTEAAGMGCDIPFVKRVVQFMVPNSLSIWLQRAGRAGRSATICAEAHLLVQPTVFQEVKKKDAKEDDETKFRKDVEADLRAWIETEGCRREAAAICFDDGVQRKEPKGICCDNCLRKTNPNHRLLQPLKPQTTTPQRSPTPSSDTDDLPSSTPNENGKRPMAPAVPIANRRGEHLKEARTILEDWKAATYINNYSRRPWGAEALLPAKVLTTMATHARRRSLEDLIDAGWSPTHARRHGEEVLQLLYELDVRHHEEHEAGKRARADERKQETIKRAEARKQEAARQRAVRAEEKAREKAEKEEQKAREKAAKEKDNTGRQRPSKRRKPLSDVHNSPQKPSERPRPQVSASTSISTTTRRVASRSVMSSIPPSAFYRDEVPTASATRFLPQPPVQRPDNPYHLLLDPAYTNFINFSARPP